MDNLKNSQEVLKSSVVCVNGIPSVDEFFNGFNYQTYLLVLVLTIYCVLKAWIYIKNVRNTFLNTSKELKSKCFIVCSIYPVKFDQEQINKTHLKLIF